MSDNPERWGAAQFMVTTWTGSQPKSVTVKGRVRWSLECLIRAGAKGCTPIDHPGPRWSAYVFELRKLGVVIETLHEKHGGPFKGNHARYVLRSTVTAAGGKCSGMMEAERITRALKGHWYGRYGVTRCPAHGDDRPSLSLADGDNGRLLARCHAGCTFVDILDALKGLGLVAGVGAYTPPSREDIERLRRAETEQAEKQEARALKCWREAQPIAGTIAEIYFRHRGITAPLPDTLRFHPECWHPSGSRLPAVVALVEGAPRLAVHRTYLRRDGVGKADTEPAKAMLGAVAGGGVILSRLGQDSVVCEGIETGLSLASGILTRPATIIAALSASGMKRLTLPDNPGRLTIATDGDDAGRAAGNDLGVKATALGWRVSILPAPNGRDWNDVLMARSTAA